MKYWRKRNYSASKNNMYEKIWKNNFFIININIKPFFWNIKDKKINMYVEMLDKKVNLGYEMLKEKKLLS